MKVIIVGTEERVCIGLRAHLVMQGHDVQIFASGEAALLHVETDDVDIFLIDRKLWDMTPFEVAMHLHRWRAQTKVSVLILQDASRSLH